MTTARAEEILALTEPWHGTAGGYHNHNCRGPRCSAANTMAKSDYIARARAWFAESGELPEGVEHGTRQAYEVYGCKCPGCRSFNATRRREQRARRATT